MKLSVDRQWAPPSARNPIAQLLAQVHQYPDAPFLGFDQSPYRTYSQVLNECTVFASRLAAAGLKPGDRLVSMLPARLESVYTWLAATMLELVDIPINPGLRGHSLVHVLATSCVTHVLADAQTLKSIVAAEADLPQLSTVLLVDDEQPEIPNTRLSVRILSSLSAQSQFAPAPVADHKAIATTLFTSGTTGPAKGVLMPHTQCYAIGRLCAEGMRLDRSDTYYCFHPLFHMAGRLGAVYAALIVGCRIRVDTTFDPGSWLTRIRESGATATMAHGPMIEMIHQQPGADDDRQNPLRVVLAVPLPRSIGDDFVRRFDVTVVEAWGSTEVNICCWQAYGDTSHSGAAGQPVEDLFEIVIVDPETDEPLPIGQVGEITVRPLHPWLTMQGYLGMPETTIHAWRNFRLHSGDAGYFDADGYLYFADRLGDRIRRRGENISAYEIEIAASAFPGVCEAAAVGVPSAESEDEVLLCITTKGHELPDWPALFRYLVAELPHHMVPLYYRHLDQLPRTMTNKVQKALLRRDGSAASSWSYKEAGLSIRETRNTMATPSQQEI